MPNHRRPAVPDQVRIAIMDRAPVYRRGVQALVDATAGFEWAGGADGVTGLLAVCDLAPPHVLLVDSGLDVEFRLVRQVSERRWWTAVVVLSRAPADDIHAECARRAGAHGWVDRDCSATELVDAIRKALIDGGWPASRAGGPSVPIPKRLVS